MLQGRFGELLQEPVMFQASCSKGGSISCWCLQLHNILLVPSASNPCAGHGAERYLVKAEMAQCCRRSPASYGNAKPPAPTVQGLPSPGQTTLWLGVGRDFVFKLCAQPKVWHGITVSAAQMPSVSMYTLAAATMTLQNAFIYTKFKVRAREK